MCTFCELSSLSCQVATTVYDNISWNNTLLDHSVGTIAK